MMIPGRLELGCHGKFDTDFWHFPFFDAAVLTMQAGNDRSKSFKVHLV